MEKHATYLVLVMCTHFYIIPSTNSASLTTESQASTSPEASHSTWLGETLPTQIVDDSYTQNNNGTATSPSSVTYSDITEIAIDINTGETTDDTRTTPTTISTTPAPTTMSSNTEASRSEKSKNDIVSHMTSGWTSTERETSADKTIATSGADSAATGAYGTDKTATEAYGMDSAATGASCTDKAATGASRDIIGSMFGTIGLPITIGLAICIFLLIIIMIMINRARKKRHSQSDGGEESMPKLKMLEIKDDKVKRNNHDDLQTFSLDYEKHVQEKIDEHKKKSQPPPKAKKPNAGVSTFVQKKKQSLRSNQSVSSYSSAASPLSPVSPSSSSSPAETKPLIKQPDDEPFVFNFAKRPSELLTTRHTSAFDEAGRRRSNVSGGKTPKLTTSDERFDI